MDGKEEQELNMWKKSVASMKKYLRSETQGNMVYLAELNDDYKILQAGELVCFMPGNLLLGARYLNDSELAIFAAELMKACYDTWALSPTGLAPETWSWIDKSQNVTNYPQVMQIAMQTTGYLARDVSYDLRPGKMFFFCKDLYSLFN